jgi:hypothetical protein
MIEYLDFKPYLHNSNFSTQELRQEDHKFKASLGYIERPCLKQKQIIITKKKKKEISGPQYAVNKLRV